MTKPVGTFHALPFPPASPVPPVTPPTFSSFFGMSNADYPGTIAIGAPLDFPNAGPTSGAAPTRTGPGAFLINLSGVYEVNFQGSFDEPGQLALFIGVGALARTRVGRATGTSQIAGSFHVQLTLGAVVSIVNDASPAALTVTPLPGGTLPAGVTLTFEYLGPGFIPPP